MTSGSPLGGAATMFAFGLGTLPAMFAVGAAAAEIGHAMKRVWVRRLAGGSVLLLGALQLVAVGRQATAPRKTESASCCHGPVAEASIEAR